MDEQWTIRGLARELGVEWGWVYNRIRRVADAPTGGSHAKPPVEEKRVNAIHSVRSGGVSGACG